MSDYEAQLNDISTSLAVYMEGSHANQATTNEALEDIRAKLMEPPSGLDKVKINQARAATIATTRAIANSIDKFESGNSVLVAQGVMDVVTEFSAFASLAGPEGALVGAVIGSVSAIVSAILGRKAGIQTESEESMITRVITEALRVQTADDLKSSAWGVTGLMKERIGTLTGLLSSEFPLTENAIDLISDDSYLHGGVEFLDKLYYYIQKSGATSSKAANDQAILIQSYMSIAYLRTQMLLGLSVILYAHNETALGNIAREKANEQLQSDRSRFSHLRGRPSSDYHRLYSAIMLLSAESRGFIEAYNGNFQGKLVRIFNTKQQRHLMVGRNDSDDRSEATATALVTKENIDEIVKQMTSSFPIFLNTSAFEQMLRQQLLSQLPIFESNSLFRVFGMLPGKTGTNVSIFSVGGAGYVYAADYNPYDNDRRRVNGWMPGNPINQGTWTFTNAGGSVFIKNNKQNEYMYAADYGSVDKSTNRVFTWRKGNPVNQGYWDIQILE